MIKNKNITCLLVIANIFYMLAITLYKDPFIYNFSMYTNTVGGYIAIFLLCILLSINLANITYLLNRKYLYIAILGPVIGCIFPFDETNRNILSNLHEICAYISLFFVLFITFINIYKYKAYNFKKANIIEKLFIMVFLVDGIIYLNSFGVTSIQEFILLTTSLLIHLYMYLKIFVL